MKQVSVALIGCGTVGTGVARLLLDHGDRLAERCGTRLVLKHVVVRNPSKPRQVTLPDGVMTTDLGRVLRDPSVPLAIEVVGGVDWARQAVLSLLSAGKDVVTANKALLAEHGGQIFAAARECGRAIAFEASVAGGIPIIAALSQSLAANQILSIQGILNGTCNFILSRMTEQGQSYAEALAEAQALGYAEADPTLDVDGTDAAHKLSILSQIAFGASIKAEQMDRRGISGIQSIDIQYARELGYTIKLLAEAWLHQKQLALHVSPVLLRHQTPLAQVRGPYNAVHVVGDAVGDTLFYGAGAGQMPTASSVVADLLDLAVDRQHRLFQSNRLWSGRDVGIVVRSSSTVRSRFYLRLMIADRPGVLGEVARILASHDISISSVIQHEALEEQQDHSVPLVIMTHTALTEAFCQALGQIDQLDCVTAPSTYYPVAD